MIIKKIKGKKRGYLIRCKCDYCDKEFEKRYIYAKNCKNHFCSKRCYSKWQVGRVFPEETKKKMSLALKNNKYTLGHKLSEEHKKKIGDALKGRKYSKETLLKMSEAQKGRILSGDHKKKISKALKGRYGSSTSRWKGGKTKNNGYVYLKNPKHPFCTNQRYVLEHRLIMEKFLGRLLKPGEVVHHKNDVRDDNRIKNLMLFEDDIEHRKFHRELKQKELNLI